MVRWLDPASAGASELGRWAAVLDVGEQAAAARFFFDADRQQYVAAHALARGMLAAETRASASALTFARRPGGKPMLTGGWGTETMDASDLSFSLSHTRTLVAVAHCRGRLLGIDVEHAERRTAASQVADRFFAPSEADLVRAGGTHTFLRLWTLKEAYIKATGEGLARSLRSFSFKLDPLRIETGADVSGWRFAELRPAYDHFLAIAVFGGDRGSLELDIDARQIAASELTGMLQ